MARTAIKSQTSTPVKAMLDISMLRSRIIEEYYLRKQIEREEALRRDSPQAWRRSQSERIARNRADSGLNRMLREVGCPPVAPELSLKQKMKKLQQLVAYNRAESARFRVAK